MKFYVNQSESREEENRAISSKKFNKNLFDVIKVIYTYIFSCAIRILFSGI